VSFQEPKSDIAICNKALDLLSQQPLSGTLANPLNNAARACARHYKTVVRTLLEQHHFGLATKRVALVQATNDRSNEWLVAYAPPTDMAFPVSIGPYSGSQVSYYRGIGALFGILAGRKVFEYAGGVLYTQLSDAELEYVSFTITEQDFNQTFENLVVIFLASVLAHPVVKDRQLGKDLYEEGMSKLNWAIAQNLNIGGPTYGHTPTDTELARAGFSVDLLPPFGTF
jgi:hypothetical protein